VTARRVSVTRPGRWPQRAKLALVAAAPWLWFAVRDLALVDQLLDGVAIAMPLVLYCSIPMLAFAAILRRKLLVCGAMSLAAVALASIVAPWIPEAMATPVLPFRLVSANVFGGNADKPDFAKELIALDADVVITLESLSGAHELLSVAYPHTVAPRQPEGIGVYTGFAVLSATRPVEGVGVLRIVLDAPGGAIALYAAHLSRAWVTGGGKNDVVFFRHRAIVEHLLDSIRQDPLPTVLAGDLNMSDRTSKYRAVRSTLRDAMLVRWAGPTSRKLLFRPLLLRIDHIFVPKQWCAKDARRIELTGSDHDAVTATIGPC